MRRIGLLTLALVLALGTLGVGYAAWEDEVEVAQAVETGDLHWEFSGVPTQGDDGLDPNCFFDLYEGDWVTMGKDVASTQVAYSEDNRILHVTVDNGYPYYANHVGFQLHALGSVPLKYWKAEFLVDGDVVGTYYEEDQYVWLDLDGDADADVEVWWGDSFGTQMHECDKIDISFEFLVLQEAPQGEELSFSIRLVAIQWNEYEVP